MEKQTLFSFRKGIVLLLVIWIIFLTGFGVADSTGNGEEIHLYALIPTGEDLL